MKKIFIILIFLMGFFNYSFAEDFKNVDGIKYVSAETAEHIWKIDSTYYENSEILKVSLNQDIYYFKVGSSLVKKNSYINPFFINSKNLVFNSSEKIKANIILDNGVVYLPISFFHDLYDDNYYDVIVVGGDPEGITAAVSAARNGAKTLLLSSEDGLGGLFTFGMLNSIDMNYDLEDNLLTKGLFEEFFEKIGRKDSFDVEEAKNIFEDMVLSEENIDYRENYSFKEPILEGNVIKGIISFNESNEEESFFGDRIIDATQDGDVCAASGVPYFVGMEDINVKEKMAATLVFKVGGVDWSELAEDIKRYREETGDTNCGINESSAWSFGKWCYDNYDAIYYNMRLRGPNFGLQKDGTVLLNALQIFYVDFENEESVQEAIRNGTIEAQNIVEYLKSKLNSFNYAYFAGVADELYVRETRHMMGEYVLKASDLLNHVDFDDKIAMGSYPVDIQSTGIHDYGQVVFAPAEYTIPYRCTVPLKVDNLYIVGKSASYSSIAAGSVRVVPVGMSVGESIGAIAMYSIINNVTPRQIIGNMEFNEDIKKLLADQGVRIDKISVASLLNGVKDKDKIEKLINLGVITAGYSNDFKLNQSATNAQAINRLIISLQRSGTKIDDDKIAELNTVKNNKLINASDMAKVVAYLFEESNVHQSDFEIWRLVVDNHYFDGIEEVNMYDNLTQYHLYCIISNAIEINKMS